VLGRRVRRSPSCVRGTLRVALIAACKCHAGERSVHYVAAERERLPDHVIPMEDFEIAQGFDPRVPRFGIGIRPIKQVTFAEDAPGRVYAIPGFVDAESYGKF
jgi:hypothetical protein